MTINIEKEIEFTFDFNENEVIEQVIKEALEYVKCPYEASVNVTLTDNDAIHLINKEYRDIDRPTDVLSFPMVEYDEPGCFDFDESLDCDLFDPDSGELVLGDIVISCEKAVEQANEYGHSVKRELAFLVAHSMFHLFGYDHMTENEAAVMEAKQKEVLDILGIKR